MDIQKQRNIRRFTINRFTLNTIAAVIFAFKTETAGAVSCPPFIVDTALAGVICDFDTSSSVTVANGGAVGGINMNLYNPLSPSFIAINTGGSINNSTGIGININSSSLSNGLSNSGLISAGSNGIDITNSTINGGIQNTGQIVSNISGTGLLLFASTINGNLANSGTITGSNLDSGISILNNTTINGDMINDGLINSENGNSILLRSNSVITGGISNNGTIRSTASTGISIINSSSIQGNIVNSGIISGGFGGLSIHNGSSVNGNISNSGTISSDGDGISIFSSTTINGGITNSGTISGGTTGIGIGSSSTISAAISNSGIIQGSTNAVRIDSSSVVGQLNILGQHARIIGAVDAVNTSVGITSGAVFTSEGTYNISLFNISANATFNMANAITVANSVNNSGILAINESTQTINGNYVQNISGLFQTGIASVANYGALFVNGIASLANSGHINVQVAQNATLHDGDVFPNVISGNVFTAPISGYQVSDNSFIWKFTAMTNLANTGVNLVASLDPVSYTACQGTYCQNAANVILGQVAAGNPAFNAYSTLASASAFQTAASQATPELINENISVTQVITRSVMDVIPMWGIRNGKSTESDEIWLKPYGASIIQDERNTVDGFNATVYGLIIGKEKNQEDGLFGGAFAFGKNDIRGKTQLSGQTINSDIYQALVYGARKLPHNFYLAGMGLIGYGNNDTSRFIPLYASTAQGSYRSWFTNLSAQLGCHIYALNQSLVLTPELDASYLYINQNSYHESGSPMDLAVVANNHSSLVLGIYGNGAYHLPSFHNIPYLTLTAYAGIARNVLNTQPQTTATFIAGGPSFSTFGVDDNKAVFRGGIGLNMANPTKPLRVNINYDAQTGNNAYSGIGSVTISYQL